MKRSGEELGGYVVSRWLGSGGMGTVYEAIDAEGRHVALKLLHPHLATDPVARARLRREVETLQRVRHPGVARVIDSETDSDEAFVVTELVAGVTLEHRVRERGALSRLEVADLGRGLRGALTATHQAGVVHRDIKPGNVMLTSTGPVLIDFGISQIVDAERYTQIGLVTGTAGYIDPHVAAGGSPDVDADWWSWAAVLAFAATGRPPFGRGSPAIVLARASAGHPDLEGLPDDVARAFAAALRPTGRRLGPADLVAVLEGAPGGVAALAAVERDGAAAHGVGAGIGGEDVTEVVPLGAAEDAPSPTRVLGPTRTPLPRPAPPSSLPPPPPYRPAAYQQPAPADYQPPVAYQPVAHQPPASGGQSPPYQPPGAWAPPPVTPAAAPPAPPSPGILLVLWLLATAFAASWPAVVLLVVLGLMLLAGAVGSGTRWLRRRRLRRARTRADVPLAWLLTPWHLVRSALVCVAAAVAAVIVGATLWFVAWSLVTGEPIGTATTGGVIESAVTAGAVAGAVGAAWLAPTGGLVREGAREVLAVVLPTRGARALVVGVGLVVALVVAGLALLAVTTPDWAPFPSPSSFM